MPKTDAELLALWKQRAMRLDCALGWIRTELRRADHLSLTVAWKNGALALLEETDEELQEFLKSVAK